MKIQTNTFEQVPERYYTTATDLVLLVAYRNKSTPPIGLVIDPTNVLKEFYLNLASIELHESGEVSALVTTKPKTANRKYHGQTKPEGVILTFAQIINNPSILNPNYHEIQQELNQQ